MTKRDAAPAGDDTGPDGTVRLRAYLPLAATTWLSASCAGLWGCGRIVPVSIGAAIEVMGSADATVGELARRLRCRACGGREVRVQVATDPRPAEVHEREGVLREARARVGGS
jgi:hypothetical protein